jgi:hypothetical protein
VPTTTHGKAIHIKFERSGQAITRSSITTDNVCLSSIQSGINTPAKPFCLTTTYASQTKFYTLHTTLVSTDLSIALRLSMNIFVVVCKEVLACMRSCQWS